MDHKTTSMYGEVYVDGMRLRSQFKGYVYAYRELTGEKPVGVVVNSLIIRKKTAKGAGTHTDFARHNILISDEDLIEWRTNVLCHIQSIVDMHNNGFYPRSTTSCIQYMRRCPYFDVCAAAPESRAFLLASGAFKDVTWSPLD
jgi:hypothetical protein